jgi:predicted Rossmann-fold nucleotide-binding protein
MRKEFGSLAALREHREAGGDLREAVIIGVDLTDADAEALLDTPIDGAVLLGCELNDRMRRRAEASSALVFPRIPDLPYRVYRTKLYSTEELFEGFDPDRPESYADTLDARIYLHTRRQGRLPDPLHALAARLHDHAITEALDDLLDTRAREGCAAPIAVMGGHALARDSAGYRGAVELGMALGASPARFTVLTGGGPGAMEAVPLGARLRDNTPAEIDAVLAQLATAPTFAGDGTFDAAAIGRWLAAGLRLDLGPESPVRTVGIPTWFYGHEPPNPVAHLHAKYFANSVREDGLLSIATGGIVYTPGSAGTVQEVFQDYAQNHYSSLGPAAPMIFLGKEFWTAEVPAAALVQQLAHGRDAEQWILVTDDVTEAVELLERYSTALARPSTTSAPGSEASS